MIKSLRSFYPAGWPLPRDKLHGEVEHAVDEEVDHDKCEYVGGGIVQHVSVRSWNIYSIAISKMIQGD